jgi:hypothetical protein
VVYCFALSYLPKYFIKVLVEVVLFLFFLKKKK